MGNTVKTKVGIIGATGYAGAELLRLILNHPHAEVHALSSVSYEGMDIKDVYPNFDKIISSILTSKEQVAESCDVVFAALPHGLSQEIAKRCDEKGSLFIDIGADFRLDSADDYKKWYNKEYIYPELHEKAVYGLCEVYRDDIKKSRIIANPGCYPTSVELGLWPSLKNKLIKTDNIIIDSKSGVTGAGRSLSQKTHFPDCNEAFSPYNIGAHRHIPEIEQTLSGFAGTDVKVTFVPHLLPVNRGIISTIYTDLMLSDMNLEEIYELYIDLYRNEKFVRIKKIGDTANLKNVRGSNYCDISLHQDKHTGKLIIVSAIDNMVKGAAGQAIQNMNISLGLAEDEGLNLIPAAF